MSKEKDKERRDRREEARNRLLGEIDLSPLSPQEKSRLRYEARMADGDLAIFSVEESLKAATQRLKPASEGE